MAQTRLDLLRNMPIFGGLTNASLSLILELAKVVEVPASEFFFREGDEGTSAYVLERGRVEILKRFGGREYHLNELATGDCFGEIALIDFGLRSASVQALEDSTALVLSPKGLLEVSKQSLEQYAMIYMNMARELGRRLRLADTRLFEARVESRSPDADYTISPA
jgi:CRP-like cAMP-binding protein